jgi:hypothetical protein
MANRPPVFRPHETDPKQAEQTREIAKTSREVLQQPEPDTFLGRKTHEPFPREDDE